MLYSVQSEVLTFLGLAGLRDRDGFAAAAAERYLAHRANTTSGAAVGKLMSIQTSTFSTRRRERRSLTTELVQRLDKKFIKSLTTVPSRLRPMGAERTRVIGLGQRSRRRGGEVAFSELIARFKAAVEADGIDPFWKSRKKSELRPRPEQIGQLSLMMFLNEPIRALSGFTFREVRSGIGYIDVMAVFGRSKRYVVELKVRSSDRVLGAAQLAKYLDTLGLSHGWLILFDSRAAGDKQPKSPVSIDGKTLTIVSVDINPPAPSSLSK